MVTIQRPVTVHGRSPFSNRFLPNTVIANPIVYVIAIAIHEYTVNNSDHIDLSAASKS